MKEEKKNKKEYGESHPNPSQYNRRGLIEEAIDNMQNAWSKLKAATYTVGLSEGTELIKMRIKLAQLLNDLEALNEEIKKAPERGQHGNTLD